jgi:ubiquinone/menaquinone biosynthesis C-methylase UbiE
MTGAASRTDDDQMAGRYDNDRAFALDQIDGWRRAVAGLVPTQSAPLLDVGSGTGIWAHAFAQWFGIRIVGIEPSSGMRTQAAAKRSHPQIGHVGGRAQAIPVSGQSGAAWLSTVIHHFGTSTSPSSSCAGYCALGRRC